MARNKRFQVLVFTRKIWKANVVLTEINGEAEGGELQGDNSTDDGEENFSMAVDTLSDEIEYGKSLPASEPISSHLQTYDLGTSVDPEIDQPQQHADEKDVVKVFVNLKVHLDKVSNQISMGDMIVRRMTFQDEDFVKKAKMEAQRVYARYEATVRNAEGRTQAIAEAQNSLRNFINGKSEQLHQILIKHGLGKLDVLFVPKPRKGNPVRARNQYQQPTQKMKAVTFKAVLSSAIVNKFQKEGETPIVEIISDFYDDFRTVLVRLERTYVITAYHKSLAGSCMACM